MESLNRRFESRTCGKRRLQRAKFSSLVVASASALVVVEKFEHCESGKTSAVAMLKTATIKKTVKKNT